MLEEIIKERKKKIEKMRKAGIDPYPAEVKRSQTIGEVLDNFSKLERIKKKVSFSGRIRGIRNQGKIIFSDIEDDSGRIQLVIKKENLKDFDFLVDVLDAGDFVEVEGYLFITKRGERSLEVKKVRILTKSLRTLPSDYYGIGDSETRLRKRYLDLILNKETKDLFLKKAKFWQSFRNYLLKEKFLEVETPILETMPGGADAEPFKTRYNALGEDFYLRISLEIALKKLLVGGFERIFEIGRIFRNEGIDAEHLQDYTQLEFYYAFADYNDLMKMVEKMYKFVIKETFGKMVFEQEGKKADFSKKWEVIDYYDIFKKRSGIDLKTCTKKDLIKKVKELKLKEVKGLGEGRLIDLIFKKTARPTIIGPAFLVNPPVSIEPLAKRHRKEEKRVERFQVMAFGTELGKGFSEANDPVDQRERFEEQMRLREGGDKEAQRLDEEFLEALEYGMPPAAGFGVSERLFSVLSGKPIRECVFFPAMRKNKD
ncbi:MAG: lysine--tRNA ligase [Candidatus Pacebacteria bacterium]|nr:lysine--tRNA ligase [Candidatus Paceibacterota bacterium]